MTVIHASELMPWEFPVTGAFIAWMNKDINSRRIDDVLIRVHTVGNTV